MNYNTSRGNKTANCTYHPKKKVLAISITSKDLTKTSTSNMYFIDIFFPQHCLYSKYRLKFIKFTSGQELYKLLFFMKGKG